MKSLSFYRLFVAFIIVYSLAAGIQTLRIAPLWWDEAWTASVAKNFVEHGYPGVYWNGLRVGWVFSGTAPSVILGIWGLKLFGFGLWQVRILFFAVSILFLLIYHLVLSKLFSKFLALGSLLLISFGTSGVYFFPTVQGSQVLSETPVLLTIFVGVLCYCVQGGARWLPLVSVSIFWGLSLLWKPQVLPFIVCAGALTTLQLWRMRQFRQILELGLTISLSYLLFRYVYVPGFYGAINQLSSLAIEFELPQSPEYVSELYKTLALNLDPKVRLSALQYFMSACGLYLLALITLAFNFREPNKLRLNVLVDDARTMKLFILSFGVFWMLWCIFLSIDFPRYLYIPIVILAPFVIEQLVPNRRSIQDLLTNAVAALKIRNSGGNRWRALSGLLICCVVACLAIQKNILFFLVPENPNDAQLVAEYLEHRMKPDQVIETEEAELFFFTKNKYHYAPMASHNRMNLSRYAGASFDIEYKPLEGRPDFLVTGPFNDIYRVYDQYIEAGHFKQLAQIGSYRVYQRAD